MFDLAVVDLPLLQGAKQLHKEFANVLDGVGVGGLCCAATWFNS